MKGLELSRKYFEEYGLKMINDYFPEYLDKIAFGLCGEGSECLGFDDAFSRDHDFGAGFCMWLNDEDYEVIGNDLNSAYLCLPEEFLGFPRRELFSSNEQRIGAMRISDFYRKFTGLNRIPENLAEWRMIPEHFLSIVTSGEVFKDDSRSFSEIREGLLSYYPNDILIKKLVARIGVMAQSGQYNYPRCIKRGEKVAASLALAEFMKATISAVYLLNKKYMPFYKWAHRGMRDLKILNEVYSMLDELVSKSNNNPSDDLVGEKPPNANANANNDNANIEESLIENMIEDICKLILNVLIERGLTDERDSFLLVHCNSMMQRIEDNNLRNMNIFSE